jgi:hypothetical protein
MSSLVRSSIAVIVGLEPLFPLLDAACGCPLVVPWFEDDGFALGEGTDDVGGGVDVDVEPDSPVDSGPVFPFVPRTFCFFSLAAISTCTFVRYSKMEFALFFISGMVALFVGNRILVGASCTTSDPFTVVTVVTGTGRADDASLSRSRSGSVRRPLPFSFGDCATGGGGPTAYEGMDSGTGLALGSRCDR